MPRLNFKILPKYFWFGGFIGVGLLLGIFRFFPDGKLHIFFCDVGQGDAIYIRLPNQIDLLVDGGPDAKVLNCLSKHMPFYDRTIDLVFLTHPQKDHLQGLINVIDRYTVNYFVSIPLKNQTQSYEALIKAIKDKKIPVKYLTTGDKIKLGDTNLSVIWPEKNWLIQTLHLTPQQIFTLNQKSGKVVGFSSDKDLNLFCLFLHLKLNQFDLLLTGDGDQQTQNAIANMNLQNLLPENIEVLKVPHHGSKTGMTQEFVDRVRPQLSVIEVGKNNNYGHPSQSAISMLEKWGKVMRTDRDGDIEVVSDGKTWQVVK